MPEKHGQGTGSRHGSITKAGKVRQSTPKIPKSSLRRPSGPLQRNRRRYELMLQRERRPTRRYDRPRW